MLNLTCFFVWSLGGTPPWVSAEEYALQYAWGHHLSAPCSGILMAVDAGGDHLESSWATCQQDVIRGAGRERLAPACMLKQGTPVSLWLVPTPGTATLPPSPWLSGQRVFPGTFVCLCPMGLGWRRLGSAMGASPTSWSRPGRPWSTLEASSGHMLGQFQA